MNSLDTDKNPCWKFDRKTCVILRNYGYSLNWPWQDEVGLQHEEHLELRTRGETERWDVRHQWRRDNQDQHRVFLLVRVVVIFTQCTPHRVAPRVCTQLIHAWSERHSSTLSSPVLPTSSSPYSSSISRSSCCPSTSTRIVGNTVLRQQGHGVYGRILLPHSSRTCANFRTRI